MPENIQSSEAKEQGSKLNALDTKISLRKVWAWYHEARDDSSNFRKEANIDCAYYDNDQWTEEEKQELKARGQAPIVINRIKPTIDLVLGTEAKARIDFHAAPRTGSHVMDAQIATECIKCVMDQNEGEYVVSNAFEDSVKAGWMFLEVCKNPDPFGEIILVQEVPRNDLLWDRYAKKFDLSDAKYILRPKWMDLEDAIAKFPNWKDELEMAVNSEELEYFKEWPHQGTEDQPDRPGVLKWDRDEPIATTEWIDRARKRVKLIECWYKVPEQVWLAYNDITGDIQELDRSRITEYLAQPGIRFVKRLVRKVRMCIVSGANLLGDYKTPYEDNEYPFVPFWGYIKDKDRSPYGLIRQIRDPQDEVNKRRSKAIFLLNSRQIIATSDAIDQKENDWKQVAKEVTDPQGIIKLNPKPSQGARFEIVKAEAEVAEQYKFFEESKREIEEAGVANRELQGLESNAKSGRAIIARQIQGNLMLGKIFENYRRSRQKLGQLIWSRIRQFWTAPKTIRVTDKVGNYDFIKLNERIEFNNRPYIKNSISQAKVDILIDEQAFNATIRQSLANQMFDLITKLPPEVGLLMLDDVIDFLDLPNKDQLMRKVQMAQGVMQQKVDSEMENQRANAEAAKRKAINDTLETEMNVNREPEEKAMAEGLA